MCTLVELPSKNGVSFDKNGNVIQSEMIVDNDIEIGYAVNNQNEKRVRTTGFNIHYSEKETHIVPKKQKKKAFPTVRYVRRDSKQRQQDIQTERNGCRSCYRLEQGRCH